MTRARLSFAQGDPLEFPLEEVVAYGPEIHGFRAWLGAVYASAEGRWTIRFGDDVVLGFRRDELKRIRATPEGAELTLGEGDAVPLREAEVTAFGPEPDGVRAWLGRLAHGSGGDAWIRFADGHELRFAIGNGPHVKLLEPTDTLPAGGVRLPLA